MSDFGFDPNSVNLTTADPRDIVCYLSQGGNDYNGQLGARIAAIFVILIVSSAATFFPVIAVRYQRFRIGRFIYLFARYFGAGVIIATAFIHLLDPAYGEIGPQTCVGMTGHWADYSWCPAIVLASLMMVFLMDFGAEQYVERKFGMVHTHPNIEEAILRQPEGRLPSLTHNQMHSGDQDPNMLAAISAAAEHDSKQRSADKETDISNYDIEDLEAEKVEKSFREQIAAFLILEFGVIFHSIIIGLNLGSTGPEFQTLFPVLVFHQSFEGLGIGARLSAIAFPKRVAWFRWALCAGYGLTTPISIAIGLGLRTTYDAGSFTANVISGVLDATSAGILIYTGLVELLARDFLFNPEREQDAKKLTFMIVCVFVGIAVMALLGKWA